MEMGLKGKVAVITGGSEGVGRATAFRLAQEGAKVAICARRADLLEATAAEIRAATGAEVLALALDIAKAGDPERLIAETVKRFGRLDILVNNAGREASSPFDVVDDEAWQADIDLKLFGAIRAIRAATPHLKASGAGRIINLTHVGAKTPRARSVPTSVTRAAGIALTKALSKELAEHKILVNTVCVGLIWSGQWERRRKEQAPGETPAEFEKWVMANRLGGTGVPLGRMGRAEEVGDLITFLVSERGSYITGAAINVDGGISNAV